MPPNPLHALVGVLRGADGIHNARAVRWKKSASCTNVWCVVFLPFRFRRGRKFVNHTEEEEGRGGDPVHDPRHVFACVQLLFAKEREERRPTALRRIPVANAFDDCGEKLRSTA